MKTKEMVVGALLGALALLIPIACGGFLGIVFGPFSATLAAHVPVFLSMLFGPWVAVMVAGISTFGFLIKLGPIVAARAAMHIIVVLIGTQLLKRGWSYTKVLWALLPIHGLLEALIVIPLGFTLQDAGLVVGVGSMIHHGMDVMITLFVYQALKKVYPFPTTLQAAKN